MGLADVNRLSTVVVIKRCPTGVDLEGETEIVCGL